MLNARALVNGECSIALVTLDTLRYDVAVMELAAGRTPNIAAVLPKGEWEERHTPGSFTYAAHHAFFAGFLPTPASPGHHPRLFAAAFGGSETTSSETCVFEAADLVTGLRGEHGYHTICIGGVGFFNRRTALGRVLPDLFDEAYWSSELGVTDLHSTENQVRLAAERLAALSASQKFFLFLNVSALHQPNCGYLSGANEDSLETHAAALHYVDSQLSTLWTALRQRGTTLVVLCSDHGTAYGEDGFVGHRLAHPVIWTVPYAEFLLPAENGKA